MMNLREQPPSEEDIGAVFDRFAGKALCVISPQAAMSRADLSLACKALNQPIEDSEVDELFEASGLVDGDTMSRDQFLALFQDCQRPELVGVP